MKHASRSIYFTLHTSLSLLARIVNSAPVATSTLPTCVPAVSEKLSKGEIGGYVVFISLLVVLSGITAGLTLGLMSLDETQLYVLSQSGSQKQKKHAAKIIPIRKNGHLLLVSLLLLNVISNETLPIISEKVLGSGVISVVISTVMIVIFSEILPQAICSTHGLAIGAAMAIPVRITIVLMFVIAWPVAKLLDLLLGENHGMVYRRAELKELIDFHSKQAQHGGDLSIDAVTIMRGALDLQEKKVINSMTYIDDVFMLHSKTKLDRPTIQRIVDSGHSRIPIFEEVNDEASAAEVAAGLYSEIGQRKSIIGCLLAKNLLLLDPDDEVPLSKVSINHIPSVQDDLPLFDILNIFQEGRSHLAIVVKSPTVPLASPSSARGSRRSSDTVIGVAAIPRLWTDEEMAKLEPIGIITLEDVLEELIQEPIWDETDTAESRPRAGLAVPLNTGTGESLILATNRGRPAARLSSRLATMDSTEQSTPNSLHNVSGLGRLQTDIEMIKLKAHGDAILSDYNVTRSNSNAPADAKLPVASDDPFFDEQESLVARSAPLQNQATLSDSRAITNKHLSLVRPSRPLSLDMPLHGGARLGGQVSATGPVKNRFKSRSTSSSTQHSRPRRTQSASTPSQRSEAHFASSSRNRNVPLKDSRNTTYTGTPEQEVSDTDEDDPYVSMTMSAHEIGQR